MWANAECMSSFRLAVALCSLDRWQLLKATSRCSLLATNYNICPEKKKKNTLQI